MKMKFTTIFFSILIFVLPLIFIIQDVEAAAGIRLPSIESRTHFFEPNKEYEWTWSIFGDQSLNAELGGGLAQYATLHDPDPRGGPRDVTFKLQLPADLPPGRHDLFLFVEEAAPEGAMVGGIARVGGRVSFIALYPSSFLQASLNVHDTSITNNTKALLQLTSWSEQPVIASANIQLYDLNDTLVYSQQTNSVTLQSQEKKTITTELRVTDLDPGRYRAVAQVQGGQENLTARDQFLIGKFDVLLLRHTHEMRPDAVNRFEFRVESNWNEDIQGAYGIVRMLNKTEQTPSIAIRAGRTADFSTFIDLTGHEQEGTAEGVIDVYFDSGSKSFPININLTYGVEAHEETPGVFSFQLNQLTALYAALLLLVVINVLLLFRRKKE